MFECVCVCVCVCVYQNKVMNIYRLGNSLKIPKNR